MKIKNYRCKCGHNDFFFADKNNQKGIYCSHCGKWLKWADKDEQNLILNQKPYEDVLCHTNLKENAELIAKILDADARGEVFLDKIMKLDDINPDYPMDRTIHISRKENKCASCMHCEMCRWVDEVEQKGCDFYAESTNNKWVPVKDELPKEDGRYQCTYKFGNIYGVITRSFINGGWYSSVQNYIKGANDYDIIAWQPLPEPYSPESENQND